MVRDPEHPAVVPSPSIKKLFSFAAVDGQAKKQTKFIVPQWQHLLVAPLEG